MPSIEQITQHTPLHANDKKQKKEKKSSKSETPVALEQIELPVEKKKSSKKDKNTSKSEKIPKEVIVVEEKTPSKKSKKEKKSKNSEQDESVSEERTQTVENVKKEKKEKKRKTSVSQEQIVEQEQPKKQKIAQEISTPVIEQVNPLSFENFRISKSTKQQLVTKGIQSLFQIQASTFDPIYDGKDVLGRARTGTGKTMAFALPIVERLLQLNGKATAPRVLVMTPTRELAGQIAREFESICGSLTVLCVYGGVPYDNQCNVLRRGVDIIVGTPGRLMDHIERGTLKLKDINFIVLDEADQMLDIGFADNMEKVLTQIKEEKAITSQKYQTLLFSATLPQWIKQAVEKYMKTDKITVDLIGNEKLKTSENVKHYAIPSRWQNRADILGDIVTIYGRGKVGKTIIFVETKGECNDLAMHEKLKDSQVIHGDIAQKQREISMQGFRDGKFRSLIATNVCSRGVDIPEVDLVINCEPPTDVESYIHRSGRTGRAGKNGVCVTFYKPQQEYLVDIISRKTGVQFTRIGAPQPQEIIAAYANETLETLKTLHPEVLTYFSATAEDLLASFDCPKKAVSACLALLCNTIKPLAPRSLLSANEGFYTILFRVDQTIRNVGFIKSICTRSFPGLTYEDTRGWRMTKDEMGVVVDVVSEKVEIKEDGIWLAGSQWYDDRGVKMEIPKELPELKDADAFTQGNSRPSYGRGGSSGGRGGRGGSRGGAGYHNRGRGGSNNQRR